MNKLFLVLLLAVIPLSSQGTDVYPNQWVNPMTKQIMSGAQVQYKLDKADVILIGEIHDSVPDHIMQLETIKKVYAKDKNIVIAMEAFDWNDQKWLNKWLHFTITTDVLIKEVNKVDPWGFDFALIMPILIYAQTNHISIAGIRAPKKLINQLKMVKGSADFERFGLSRPEGVDKDYMDYLNSVMSNGHHTISPDKFKQFAKAQIAMDVTMADRISTYATYSKVVVLVGSGHVVFGWGIEYRLTNLKVRSIITVPNIFKLSDLTDYSKRYASMILRTK